MDIPTRTDLYQIGRDYVRQRARRIDPRVIDTEGSDANIIVGSSSVVAHAVAVQIGYNAARLLSTDAEDEDLDRLYYDRYQLPRTGASVALGEVVFFRDTADAGAGTIDAGIRLRTTAGVEFVTTTPAVFGAADLEARAEVRSTQAGSANKAGENTIRKIDDLTDLFDQSVQVTNESATAAGDDAETNERYRLRGQLFWQSATRGVLSAIELGAMTAEGVDSASAVEVTLEDGTPARVVEVYVADTSGTSNRQLTRLVDEALMEYRCGGIAAKVRTSIPVLTQVQVALTFAGGSNTVELAVAVRAAIVSFVNTLGVNRTLYRDDLAGVVRRFAQYGVIPNASTIVAPTGDVVPALGTCLRARTEDVTVGL